jgi:hypothetical protein
MSWEYEHGPEFQVPALISDALPDQSWHNDVCPSFGVELHEGPESDIHDLRLWVEHPDPDQRENLAGYRYAVNYHPWSNVPVAGIPRGDEGYAVIETDDPQVALTAYWETYDVIVRAVSRRIGGKA